MAVRDVLAAAVERIELDSQLVPTLTMAEPFASAAGRAGGGALLNLVKPRVVVVLRGGERLTLAPAGAPNPNAPAVVGVVVLVALAVALVVAVRWMRR